MIKLELQQTDNVLTAINKIKAISDLNIEITIPRESVLFENVLNLKLIQSQADKLEKSIDFVTDDELGNTLIGALSGKDIEYIPEEFEENLTEPTPSRRKLKLHIGIPHIAIPSFIKAKKGLFIVIILFLALVGSFIYYGKTAPKAKAIITVGSLPFTRSITVKVKADASTNVEQMVLKGSVLSITVEESMEKDTTGTKTVGEKAEGEIVLYNKTTSKIKLEKGNKVTYGGKSTDLNYFLKGDVEVPANAPQDPLDPASPIIPGEATIKIEAGEIGESYNLDGGKSFELSDYEKSELEGKNKEKIEGGKSEEIKIVAEADRNNLSTELKAVSLQKANDGIKNKLGSSQKLIEGSTETAIVSESFSAEVGDEKDKLSLTQKVTADALVYLESDLNSFIDEYFKSVIPENHYMPDKDKQVTVDILGKSTNSVLTSKEADIQVTLRSIIIPDIKEDEVKESLRGKTDQEARTIIENLKNVEYYEFSISPVVPLFSKVPNNLERIEVILNKEDKGESL